MTARIRAAVARDGWAVTSEEHLLLDGAAFTDAFGPTLKPDPRGEGKQHARDVIDYQRSRALYAPARSIAHVTETGQVVDDFSRLHLLGRDEGYLIARRMLGVVPEAAQRDKGRMSLDYFRYTAGTGSPAHQDKFGDFVIIWVLGRSGGGGESFLTHAGGGGVFRGVLGPGAILVFRDELFEHGFDPMTDTSEGPAWRDVLIGITLKEPGG